MGKKGKKSTTTHTWAISHIKGTPAVEIGWVDAPDAEPRSRKQSSAMASLIASSRSGWWRAG
jgi:hypothetical protein